MPGAVKAKRLDEALKRHGTRVHALPLESHSSRDRHRWQKHLEVLGLLNENLKSWKMSVVLENDGVFIGWCHELHQEGLSRPLHEGGGFLFCKYGAMTQKKGKTAVIALPAFQSPRDGQPG